jgi:Icc-related predicted phosphoesterase
MTKLRIVSDLHFEFHKDGGRSLVNEVTQGDFDVLILAGDIGDFRTFYQAVTLLSTAVAPRPVLMVLGNHEAYGSSLELAFEEAEKVKEVCSNLTILEQSVCEIQGQRFIGCTLWYPHPIQLPADAQMGDFEYIEGGLQWVHERAKASAKFLRETIQPGDVVITHMVPHLKSIAKKFERSPINGYFIHNVGDVVEHGDAKLWIHGHTHTSHDYVVGKTRVVCNPFGYVNSRLPGEPNRDFDPTLTVEV